MKSYTSKKRVTNHFDTVELSLHLIREELKTRKFFNTLREAGIEDCYLQPDLGTLILKSVGLNDGKDETFYHYSDLMDRHSKKIIADHDSIQKQALKVYRALVNSRGSESSVSRV